MIILSTIPLDHRDVIFIRDKVYERHELLMKLQMTGDCSVTDDRYLETIVTDRFHIQPKAIFNLTDNYLVYVYPCKLTDGKKEFAEIEYQYSYESSYFINDMNHTRVIDNPLRYWNYLTTEDRERNDFRWKYEPLDEFWMNYPFVIDLDKVDGIPDSIRTSIEGYRESVLAR